MLVLQPATHHPHARHPGRVTGHLATYSGLFVTGLLCHARGEINDIPGGSYLPQRTSCARECTCSGNCNPQRMSPIYPSCGILCRLQVPQHMQYGKCDPVQGARPQCESPALRARARTHRSQKNFQTMLYLLVATDFFAFSVLFLVLSKGFCFGTDIGGTDARFFRTA